MRSVIRALTAILLFFLTVSSAQAESVTVNGTVVSSVDSTVSTFTASPAELPADGIATSTLIVIARNSSGVALPNKQVTITSSRGSLDEISCQVSSEVLQQNTATTDSNGTVTCYISSTTAGTSTLTAVVDTITLASHPTVVFTGSSSTTPTPGGTTTTTTPSTKTPKAKAESSETTPSPTTETPAVKVPQTIPEVAELVGDEPQISLWILIGIGLAILLLTRFPWFWLSGARRWGVVRDTISRVPVSGAWVYLFDLAQPKRSKKTLTDPEGQYGFNVPDHGQYWLEINTISFQAYKSPIINLNQLDSQTISYDIDLLPLQSPTRATVMTRVARAAYLLRLALLVTGSIFALLLFIQERSLTTLLLISLYLLLWIMGWINRRHRKDPTLVQRTQAGQLAAA